MNNCDDPFHVFVVIFSPALLIVFDWLSVKVSTSFAPHVVFKESYLMLLKNIVVYVGIPVEDVIAAEPVAGVHDPFIFKSSGNLIPSSIDNLG